MTRYHLVLRRRTSHNAPFPASRKFRQCLGFSFSPQSRLCGGPIFWGRITTPHSRYYGRTRRRLTTAHRPCSKTMFSRFCRTSFHQPRLSDRFRKLTLLFNAFLDCKPIMPQKARFVNCNFGFSTSLSAAAPQPRRPHRPPACPRSCREAPRAQSLRHSPGGHQTRKRRSR